MSNLLSFQDNTARNMRDMSAIIDADTVVNPYDPPCMVVNDIAAGITITLPAPSEVMGYIYDITNNDDDAAVTVKDAVGNTVATVPLGGGVATVIAVANVYRVIATVTP